MKTLVLYTKLPKSPTFTVAPPRGWETALAVQSAVNWLFKYCTVRILPLDYVAILLGFCFTSRSLSTFCLPMFDFGNPVTSWLSRRESAGSFFFGKLPIIYTPRGFGSVSITQQRVDLAQYHTVFLLFQYHTYSWLISDNIHTTRCCLCQYHTLSAKPNHIGVYI